MPPTILVIRHAEKPAADGPPHGVDESGSMDPESLSTRGWQRAGALVSWFLPDDGDPGPLPRPTRLIASKVGPGSSSRRPLQTIQPLADRLGLAVDTRFIKPDYAAMVAAVRGLDGVVLVAWEHNLIPTLVEPLLGRGVAVPAVWPDDRFDVVWVFEPDGHGTFGFRQVPTRLLAGDRPEPIA